MIQFFKKIFGIGPATNYKLLIQNGAAIIDVRTPQEYKNGHIQGSVNLPLDSIKSNFSKIRKDKPVITCCASGMRSGVAKKILKANGFEKVYNGGSWNGLMHKIH